MLHTLGNVFFINFDEHFELILPTFSVSLVHSMRIIFAQSIYLLGKNLLDALFIWIRMYQSSCVFQSLHTHTRAPFFIQYSNSNQISYSLSNLKADFDDFKNEYFPFWIECQNFGRRESCNFMTIYLAIVISVCITLNSYFSIGFVWIYKICECLTMLSIWIMFV